MPWQGHTELVLTHPWDGSLRLGLDEGPQKMKETFKKCLTALKVSESSGTLRTHHLAMLLIRFQGTHLSARR